MALVTWDPSYSVKVRRCDDDHKKLFDLINTLHAAMLAGKGTDTLGTVVKELSDYTKFHFAAEEAILERTKYPGLSGHRTQHRDFEAQVDKFARELRAGKAGNSIEVMTLLKDWLARHIKLTDQQYSAHVNASGVN